MNAKKKDASAKWLALLVICIGTFMASLDSSIVNIAVSKMMSVFGASLDDVKWILTAYTLTLGAIVPLSGYLGDVFGYKKVFIFALAAFTLGSFLCGISWSNTAMIVFRIIQAMGGGMIIPVGMAMVMQIFPPEGRGTAMGFWGIAATAAPAIGPTLGGYIIQNLDWRLIFYVNVPIGICGVILAGILLEGTPPRPFKQFDYLGFISSTMGIVSILYVLGEGTAIDWENIKNPLLIVLGVGSMLLFVINELTHPDPLLELRVLKRFDFTISQIIQCIMFFVLMGGMYVVPLFLQNLRGYTAMETGIILFPSALVSGLMMPIGGKLFDKIGAKLLCIIGMLILIISSYLLAFINMDTSRSAIISILTIRGAGLGLVLMPITTVGMNAIPQHLSGKASALNNVIKQIAISLSVTIMTTTIQSRLDLNYSKLSEQITPFNPVAKMLIRQLQGLFMQNGYSQSEANSLAISVIAGVVQKQAYVDAVDYALAMTTVIVLIAIVLVLLMRNGRSDQESSLNH
ncbi:DHA2 family efflux MFS transporter permease subunit [Desulfosporosinus sp. PR]|uniref:DHA2 family efflux MFS transporter permease subunit n=1 Tax=Candidatus Desulfosporosinus nitrosoreducens TaxID=3401928 RepID=UPI0027FEB2AC|nr:DHA2 family efflux MFS transporter permease subunit [Desulfosporosinus sp. PR]MDQ7092317.1 DHA2 family efflux MFS transporter permease subunit [Desulfosporosinus sp. PR]